jgi:AcrR family transcriptional regulator
MPGAREALLDAASAALAHRPWAGVRMVDIALAAGVSRQTLYNEFGSKGGLAEALLRRETDRYPHGVEQLLAAESDALAGLASVAEWTVSQARARPLLWALLTGCWRDRLPTPRSHRAPPWSDEPGDADRLPTPRGLVMLVSDRAAVALASGRVGYRSGIAPALRNSRAVGAFPGRRPRSGVRGAPDPLGRRRAAVARADRTGRTGRLGCLSGRSPTGRFAPARAPPSASRPVGPRPVGTGSHPSPAGTAAGPAAWESAAGVPPAARQWADPESCRPITPMITSEMETSFSTETTSFRKIIP